jgi:TRAP-type C4-dicarboxylate transport system permease small subunit
VGKSKKSTSVDTAATKTADNSADRAGSAASIASADDVFHAPVTYPDDGELSKGLRSTDRVLGLVEQGLLFAILTAVVLTASGQAISGKIFHHSISWSFDVVRDGVFAIAMLGAAFASHQQRHLAMDLLGKRLSARGRLILRVLLALFIIGVVGILLRSGWRLRETLMSEGGKHLIPTGWLATLVPFGAGLIIVHTILHMLIDIDYLLRGKLPPEKMRLSH